MRIGTVRDLGLYVRQRRQDLGKTQLDLAATAGVSRRWLASFEAGKPSAEIGLVLRTLAALNVKVDLHEWTPGPDDIDLDKFLAGFGVDNDQV